ncbi:hypothetical protein JZ751_011505, partial [Albula glossodonta]
MITQILYYLRTLTPVSCPAFPDDRRQSVSRQPSFTYSEWTDAKQDLFDLDSVPETPVFDCSMDMKPEADPVTLTVKPVGLQESRALDDTALQTEFYVSRPDNGPKPTVHSHATGERFLELTVLIHGTPTGWHQETPMNFVDPKEYNFPGVVRKNRYKTILPNTHSRVCLKTTDPDADFLSTYINANYMRGYGGQEKAYIATQGPTVNTVSDFWRMVWQESSPIIVMITNVEEKNEVGVPLQPPTPPRDCSFKCTEYWPEDTVVHEGIEIRVVQVIQADDYSLRIFSLKVEEARQQAPPGSGPVIVHCSAGIGRTGCFIATTLLCKQLKNEGMVDILKTTCQLRLDRGGMIQTAEQYQFVHHVLSLYEKQVSRPSEEARNCLKKKHLGVQNQMVFRNLLGVHCEVVFRNLLHIPGEVVFWNLVK